MSDSSPQLEYAPSSPQQRRAVHARRWVMIAIAVLVVAGGAILVPRYLRHAEILLMQRRFRDVVAPPTQVVFETDPAEAKRLLMSPNGYTPGPNGEAMLIDAGWQSFYTLLGGGYQTSGTVFVGELRTKDGRPAIISLDLNRTSAGSQHWLSIAARAVVPGTTYRSPDPISTATRGDGSQIPFQPSDALRVYAAQRDPNDPSHVTLDYVLNGTTYTIDGWLEDVGYLLMEQRN